MIPVLFGPDKRRKYGVFTAAIGHGSKGRGVVICDALYDEALCAHRAISFASSSMAETRWNSLRFDYFGTGDSGGETGDFSLAQALDDTHDAIDELKTCAGLEEVYLLGIRFGGSLATLAAAARKDVRGLILWDPIIEGRQVLQRYAASASSHTGTHAIEGFSLPIKAQVELQTLSVKTQLVGYTKPMLMVCTAPTTQHRHIAAENPLMDFREMDAPEAWSNTAMGGVRPLPNAVVSEIRKWQG